MSESFERASLDNGLNYTADILIFCGAVLLHARDMPRETWRRGITADSGATKPAPAQCDRDRKSDRDTPRR
jgi:hypothetical protein